MHFFSFFPSPNSFSVEMFHFSLLIQNLQTFPDWIRVIRVIIYRLHTTGACGHVEPTTIVCAAEFIPLRCWSHVVAMWMGCWWPIVPPSCGDDGMDVEGPQRSDLEPVGTEYHYSDNWIAYVYVCWLGTSNFGTGPVLALFLISRFLMRLSLMLVEVCANIDFCCKDAGEGEIVHKYSALCQS